MESSKLIASTEILLYDQEIPDVLWMCPIANEVIVEEETREMQKVMPHHFDQPKDLGIFMCGLPDVQ